MTRSPTVRQPRSHAESAAQWKRACNSNDQTLATRPPWKAETAAQPSWEGMAATSANVEGRKRQNWHPCQMSLISAQLPSAAGNSGIRIPDDGSVVNAAG